MTRIVIFILPSPPHSESDFAGEFGSRLQLFSAVNSLRVLRSFSSSQEAKPILKYLIS